MTLVSRSEACIRDLASSRLLAFSKHESLRPALGSAGAVGLLIGRVRDDFDGTSSHRLAVVNALCHYCQEAVNRVRMRDGKGLELMLMLLGEPDYSLIHNRLISALVCFLYDENIIEILLQNGVVGVLVDHLRRCAHIVGASANTGLGLFDEECVDLVLPGDAPITECDTRKQEDGLQQNVMMKTLERRTREKMIVVLSNLCRDVRLTVRMTTAMNTNCVWTK